MKKFKYFFRAVALSVRIKSPVSFIISVVGFAAAFLPMFISLRLQVFTDEVQLLFNNPELRSGVIISFLILALLYITQTVFSLIEKYVAAQDTARIKRYLKEQILNLLTSIPYKYIENRSVQGKSRLH